MFSGKGCDLNAAKPMLGGHREDAGVIRIKPKAKMETGTGFSAIVAMTSQSISLYHMQHNLQLFSDRDRRPLAALLDPA
jgi:hypothetical protein